MIHFDILEIGNWKRRGRGEPILSRLILIAKIQLFLDLQKRHADLDLFSNSTALYLIRLLKSRWGKVHAEQNVNSMELPHPTPFSSIPGSTYEHASSLAVTSPQLVQQADVTLQCLTALSYNPYSLESILSPSELISSSFIGLTAL